MVLPTSNLPFLCSIKNPSLHQGTGVSTQSSSKREIHSFTLILSVLTRIDFLKKDNVNLLNSGQSVRALYCFTNGSLNTYLSASGKGLGIAHVLDSVFKRVS